MPILRPSCCLGPLLAAACVGGGVSIPVEPEGTQGSGTEAEGSSSSSGAGTTTVASLDSGSTGTGEGEASDASSLPAGILASTSFVVPSGTVVEEFHFETELLVEPGVVAGTLVVAVADLSHPRRDQATLCPSSHPLDGCATVDYGAFGMTHDNRVTFEGPRGPWAVHLYKDRSLAPEPEMLPLNE